MKEFSYSDVEAATKDFALERLIGKGSHGCVYRGTLEGGSRHVAVKRPTTSQTLVGEDGGGAKLDNEIDILASIHSSNLVNLLGVVISSSRGPTSTNNNSNHNNKHELLVMEFMPNGSLHDLLHVSPVPPTWLRRTRMALQIAQAIRSLHEATPRIIHRDIKSANILLDASWNARLSDFSLAVRYDPRHSAQCSPAGTIGYLDPGYTGPGKLGPENDVFSFGVVLLELVSRRQVMDVACDPTSIVAWALPLIEADRELEICDPSLQASMQSYKMESAVSRVLGVAARCVSSEEERRPSIGEIVSELQRVIEHARFSRCRNLLRINFSKRIYSSCMGRAKARVTSTTKIVCRNHLIIDEEDDNGCTGSG